MAVERWMNQTREARRRGETTSTQKDEMIHVGDNAPAFELESDTGEMVRLSNFRGERVVLYFYPKDGTPGCTKEACGFRDALPELEAKGVRVLGVSPDEAESHRKFKAKYRLNFPLLSDPDHAVADAYGAWGRKKMYGREYEGILRSTFVIDTDGTVERVYRRVRPAGHAREVVEALG